MFRQGIHRKSPELVGREFGAQAPVAAPSSRKDFLPSAGFLHTLKATNPYDAGQLMPTNQPL